MSIGQLAHTYVIPCLNVVMEVRWTADNKIHNQLIMTGSKHFTEVDIVALYIDHHAI